MPEKKKRKKLPVMQGRKIPPVFVPSHSCAVIQQCEEAANAKTVIASK